MHYRVNPKGVQGVLNHVGDEADDFTDDLGPLQKGVPAAVGALGSSATVIGALETLLEAENSRMTAIVKRVRGCLTGATLATVAYVHGDHAMMQTAQRNAAKAKFSHIPAKWQKR